MTQLSYDGKELFDGFGSSYVDSFEVDDLMAPIIHELLSKGHITRACCQGHMHSHCASFDDDGECYETYESPGYDAPYIMFEASCLDTIPEEALKDLENDHWEMDYAHLKSEYEKFNTSFKIGDDEFFMNRDAFIYNSDRPNESERKLPFSIRLSREYIASEVRFRIDRETLMELDEGESIYDYYYQFQKTIAERLRKLYIWAKKLPDVSKK